MCGRQHKKRVDEIRSLVFLFIILTLISLHFAVHSYSTWAQGMCCLTQYSLLHYEGFPSPCSIWATTCTWAAAGAPSSAAVLPVSIWPRPRANSSTSTITRKMLERMTSRPLFSGSIISITWQTSQFNDLRLASLFRSSLTATARPRYWPPCLPTRI